MGADYVVGAWSFAGAWFLACGTFGYAVATLFHAVRGFRLRLADRWSCAGTAAALILLSILLADQGVEVVPAPFGLLLGALMVGGIVYTLTFTALRLQRIVDHLNHQLREALPLPEFTIADPEARRKAPHLMMGLFLAVYAAGGHFALIALAQLPGWVPDRANLVIARDAGWLVGGHAVGMAMLLGLLFLLMPVELIRLRFPEADYPWKRIILTRLRRHEDGLMGAHIHMAAALALSFAWLTAGRDWSRMVPAALALLAVTVFADSASALFGRRWGRRKWPHNPDKSYLGSAAGTVVALLVALPFVGAAVAVLLAAAFLVVDIVGPIPIRVSDNLLNPAALAVILVAAQASVAPLFPWY